jgi:hypothetical protein
MINDSNFHVKFFRNELKIVAYLEYITVEDFRKLRFHSSSLFWYLILIEHCKIRNSKISFNILQTNAEQFDETLNVLIIKYFILNESKDRFAKTINNLHRDHIYVDILVLFDKDLKASLIYIKKQIFFIIINFEKLFFDECKLFTFELIEIISFTLDSLSEENSLKKFNRVNAIFKFIQCVLALSRWKEIFEKENAKTFSIIIIVSDFIFDWMKVEVKNISTFIASSKDSVEKSETTKKRLKTFIMTLKAFNTKWKRKLRQHEKKHLKFKELILSIINIINKNSKDYFLRSMWKNTIRRQLRFSKLQINFLTIHVNDDSNILYNAIKLKIVKIWQKIQNHFNNLTNIHIIYYTLQMIDTNESYSYEYENSSLTLIDDVQLRANKNSKIKQNVSIDIITKKKMSSFIVSDLTISNQLKNILKNIAESNVESEHFYQKDNEDAMMKYHNDYDVRKSNVLLKWQRWILNQVCDQMSRSEKDKNILNLSKKMKREIEKTQFDQQLTALFIDVNRSSSYVYENDCAEMFVIKNSRRIAQTLRNSKCLYEKSKSNRSRSKACARRSWYAAIENTWSNRCVEEACFVRVVQLQAFFFEFTDERDCFHASAHA